MKKLSIITMAILVAMTFFVSAIFAGEVTEWAQKDNGNVFSVVRYFSDADNTYRYELKIFSVAEEKEYCFDLGKGDIITLEQINLSYYELFAISFIYKVGYQSKNFFLLAWINKGKLEVFKIDPGIWIESYQVFNEKVYLSIFKNNKDGLKKEGEAREYNIFGFNSGSFRTILKYKGNCDVVWGTESYGWDETFQRGVLVGIVFPVKYSGYYKWPETTMTIYNATKGGKLVRNVTIPPNSKVEWFRQNFPMDGTHGDEYYEISIGQSTWKARTLKGKEE